MFTEGFNGIKYEEDLNLNLQTFNPQLCVSRAVGKNGGSNVVEL